MATTGDVAAGRQDAMRGPALPGWFGVLAGMVAVAVSLGVGELAAGLFASVPSLTTAVGQLFIPFTPEPVKDVAIAVFGTADKPIFVGGVVVVAMLVGAWVGRRARTDALPATMLFVGLGLFGVFAATSAPGTDPALVFVTTAVAAGLGLATLRGLLMLARLRPPAPVVPWDDATPAPAHGAPAAALGAAELGGAASATVGRRPFLAGSAVLAGGAATAAVVGNALRLDRVRETVSAADVVLPPDTTPAPAVGPANRFDVPGLTPVVVPNDEFYRIDTALGTPLVDAGTWRLRVHGMVDRELELTYEDLLAREVVEEYVTISCVSNEVGDDLVGNALWRGVLLAPLLEEAGLEPGAGQVVGRSEDGWTAGFPVEAAFDRDAMIAFGMNGEPLPAAHGFPARLIVPGLYGYVSATKWLTELELTTWEGFDGYWIPRGWAKEGPVKTQSRIDVPADGTRLEEAGPTVVAGVAWAPTRGIARVEVRREEGAWVEAEVSAPLSDEAWVQWRATLDLPEGPSFLQVRATDGTGETQTDERMPPRPDGATGWHTVRVFT